MVIDLSLIDRQEKVIWQKTVTGEVGSFWHATLYKTAGHQMESTTTQCVRDCVKQLLEDESFWKAAKTNRP